MSNMDALAKENNSCAPSRFSGPKGEQNCRSPSAAEVTKLLHASKTSTVTEGCSDQRCLSGGLTGEFGPDAEGGGGRTCVAAVAGSGRPCFLACAGVEEQLGKGDIDMR